jgi:hypothetical protein
MIWKLIEALGSALLSRDSRERLLGLGEPRRIAKLWRSKSEFKALDADGGRLRGGPREDPGGSRTS